MASISKHDGGVEIVPKVVYHNQVLLPVGFCYFSLQFNYSVSLYVCLPREPWYINIH